MPPLRDADIIAKFRLAFEERNSGGVRWKNVPASEWLRKNLGGCTERAVNDLIHQHLRGNGTIHQAEDPREEYLHYKYHYDFHITIRNKKIYVETTLSEARMGPIVTVVNIHYAD